MALFDPLEEENHTISSPVPLTPETPKMKKSIVERTTKNHQGNFV
jgi:hypothetical protein